MNLETLKPICKRRFGDAKGSKLYEVMRKLSEKDFCVATGWTDHQVSLSTSCNTRGKIFHLSEDYQEIILPNGKRRNIDDTRYVTFFKYLPRCRFNKGWTHCGADQRE